MMAKKIKVMTVFGTRPEAIKMAPVVLELAKHPDKIVPVVTVTAQHREMLDQVLNLFDIKPDHDLDIMAAGQTLFDITSRAMMGLDKVLQEEKPDIVLVHGDTTTTFAGALASYYHQTSVGHVEAGLRTYNKYSPFPEEMNRKLTASFYGMTKHADCNNLFNKLTGKTMKSFKDLNVAYKPEDGKKRFAGTVVSIRELVNIPIIVKDFETGIKTEQGEDRCIVSIEMNGEARKFFTNSEEMKNILAQIKEVPDGFPFETTIKTEVFGKGRTKYVFS